MLVMLTSMNTTADIMKGKSTKIFRTDGRNFIFNGCEISVEDEGSATLSMQSYISRLKTLDICRARRKQHDGMATKNEEKEYRSLAGTLMYLGNAVVPQAALDTSLVQERLERLKVSHLLEANEALREILALHPSIRYSAPEATNEARVQTLSDASHGGAECDYGKAGRLSGPLIEGSGGVPK